MPITEIIEVCCNKKDLTAVELAKINFVNLIESPTYTHAVKGFNAGCFGFEELLEDNFDIVNEFLLLGFILERAMIQKQEDIASGISKTDAQYAEQFNFDCLKKKFLCKGVDVTNIFNSFGYSPDGVELELDGIDYMIIEGTNPPFVVS